MLVNRGPVLAPSPCSAWGCGEPAGGFGRRNAMILEMRALLLALVILLAPLAARAADVSGKWSGSMDMKGADGTPQSMPVTAEFKQDGKTVTGTAGREGDDQLTVQKGTIDGDDFTFEVEGPDGVYSVKLKVGGDGQLKGEVNFSDQSGNKQTASLTLNKV